MMYPYCGFPELVHDVRDIPFTYKGVTTNFPAVGADFCPACEEAVIDRDESVRFDAMVGEFVLKVNAAIVDPAYIATVRKKLALDQREAAELFGGGVNAFSQYETEKTKPPVSLVKLLKVLDRHPDLLDEVRRA